MQQFYTTWNADTLRMTWTRRELGRRRRPVRLSRHRRGRRDHARQPVPDWPEWRQHNRAPAGFWRGLPGVGARHPDRNAAKVERQRLGAGTDAGRSRSIISIRARAPSSTDIALPFSLLGLASASSLKVVAVATEENALQLWAAFPDKNPLNSPRMTSALGQGRAFGNFALTQAYTFAALQSGVTPNGGKLPGADVRAGAPERPGRRSRSASWRHRSSTLIAPDTRIDANLDGVPDQALPIGPTLCRSAMASSVTYTLRYENRGSDTARAVQVEANAYGALRFANGQRYGDLQPRRHHAPVSRPRCKSIGMINTALNGALRRAGYHTFRRAARRLRLAMGAAPGRQLPRRRTSRSRAAVPTRIRASTPSAGSSSDPAGVPRSHWMSTGSTVELSRLRRRSTARGAATSTSAR